MQTENKQPLYKVLNEQRTQGNWEFCEFDTPHGKEFVIKEANLKKDGKWIFSDRIMEAGNYTNQNKANTQYTALAVNHLHHLAEALEKIKKAIEQTNGRNTNEVESCYNSIKEALNRIS